MPHGPKSVGLDFAFPYAQNVYGIPEHTSPLSLPTTTSGATPGYYNEVRIVENEYSYSANIFIFIYFNFKAVPNVYT